MTQTGHPGLGIHRAAGPPGAARPADQRPPDPGAPVSFGALTSFYLLLLVTPMYAVSAGAGSAEAGVVTGSLMLATVLAEFDAARPMRRGYRRVFAAGALLLAAGPGPAGPDSVISIVAVSIARGIGFGLNRVVIGALVATALPRNGAVRGSAWPESSPAARDRGPSVGVWLAENTSYAVVIVITAVSALAPLAAIPWLTSPADHRAEADRARAAGRAARQPAIRRPLRPSLVFAATTVSAVWSPHSCRSRPA